MNIFSLYFNLHKHTFDFLSYLLLSDTIHTIIMSHAVWCVATFFLVLWSKWGLSGKCMMLLRVFVLFCFSFCFACCILICAYPPRVWQWCSSFCLIGVLWSSQWQCCGNHHCQPLIFAPCLHYSSCFESRLSYWLIFYARWYSVRLHVNAKDISIVTFCRSSFYYIITVRCCLTCVSHGFVCMAFGALASVHEFCCSGSHVLFTSTCTGVSCTKIFSKWWW